MEAVHDDLLTVSCHLAGGSFDSLEACRVFIKEMWRTELELDEVRNGRERLVAAGTASKAGGGFALTSIARRELESQRKTWEDSEALALEEWEVELRATYPFLQSEDVAVLKQQLRPWLDRVIAHHGAEASLLLYPAHPRAIELSRAIGDISLDFLPECGPELIELRAPAFRAFVREPTPAQRTFLGRLLNTGFYSTVLSLDPRARNLAAGEGKRMTLYLDTNFLYSLLGVGSPAEAFAAKRLLELCGELEMSLRISSWTVDELRTSIANSRQSVDRYHQSRRSAEIMAEVTGEKGFVPAFWRALRDDKDPSAFFSKFDHFLRFLKEYGVVEHPEGCAEVEADFMAIRDYASPLEGMYGPGTKRREVIEHDAKMRLLIERLRAESAGATYTDVRYWFITESTRLPLYARMPVGLGATRPAFPFCVLSSTWAQIVRAMVPRTDDLDAMIVGLLASPYVGYTAASPDRVAVERVVARIDALKDVPPSVAIAVLNDRTMATKISAEASSHEVDRLVEEATSQKAREIEEQIAQTASRATRAERERAEAEERARVAEQQAATAEQARQASGLTEAALREELQAAQARGAEERRKRLRAESHTKRVRNLVAIGIALLVAGGGASLIGTATVTGAGIVVVVAVTVVVAYVALRAVSADLAKEAVVVITLAAGVVAAGAALIPSTTTHSSTPSHAGSRTKAK
jgi:hypothetical protein